MEAEKKFFVYVDFRGDDGKPFYVGKGTERRVQDLQRNELHSRIKNKHGIIREVVFETHSEQESFEKEIQLIGELQTHVNHGRGGANFTFGGEGISGYKFTEEQYESLKKLWENPEHRASLSESKKKMWEDPEHREKIKKLWEDPERREKLSESLKKLWEDPEHKEKKSESSKKMWEDPEIKKKIKEKLNDPEAKKKMCEYKKKLWEDPEFRAMMKEKQRLGWKKKKLEKLQQEV
jgi:hypothetical protein